MVVFGGSWDIGLGSMGGNRFPFIRYSDKYNMTYIPSTNPYCFYVYANIVIIGHFIIRFPISIKKNSERILSHFGFLVIL